MEIQWIQRNYFFFDKLFDSYSGSQQKTIKGKVLRCGISENSPHIFFWKEEALPPLMKYEKNRPKDKRKSSLGNWIFTIRDFIKIWEKLILNGFYYMLGRHLNQQSS